MVVANEVLTKTLKSIFQIKINTEIIIEIYSNKLSENLAKNAKVFLIKVFKG